MQNLAGDVNCDLLIQRELDQARLIVLCRSEPTTDEVPYKLYGAGGREFTGEDVEFFERHGVDEKFAATCFSFVFTRAWYYWRVKGFIPLDIAMEMYENPNGRNDIRVAGHCACPPPHEWTVRYKVCGMNVVESYHIDTQEGLNYFVETLKKHRLI